MDNAIFDEDGSLFQATVVFLAFLARYVLIAGGAFLFFYVLVKNRMLRYRIQRAFPPAHRVRMEILYSLSTFLIFAGMGLFSAWLQRNGFGRLYMDIDAYPVWWFFVSIVAMLLLHDVWFYWSHRFMHLKAIFPLVHKVHHLSNNPTPWGAFSFHPIEAVIEGMILPLIIVVMPVNFWALMIFLLLMTVMNVTGHLGYELFPSGFTRWGLTKWSNTSTHHNMHHRLVKCNYGLYFNIWDRIMGTNHEKYEAHFEEVVARRNTAEKAAKQERVKEIA